MNDAMATSEMVPQLRHISEVLLTCDFDSQPSKHHVHGPTESDSSLYMVDNAQGVLLRKGVETAAEKVGQLPFGATCVVVESATGDNDVVRACVVSWHGINKSQATGKLAMCGWCNAKYLRPLAPRSPNRARAPPRPPWTGIRHVLKESKGVWKQAGCELVGALQETGWENEYGPMANTVAGILKIDLAEVEKRKCKQIDSHGATLSIQDCSAESVNASEQVGQQVQLDGSDSHGTDPLDDSTKDTSIQDEVALDGDDLDTPPKTPSGNQLQKTHQVSRPSPEEYDQASLRVDSYESVDVMDAAYKQLVPSFEVSMILSARRPNERDEHRVIV
eukprot:TRINITY_DN90170_c0_g1_i1.p1 TRINITY_DN90170_c0_g1~~TRINITY_DN90170_c0_g1_i1.p1  ORF type:complete len:333 (-),score=47.58 TRINITY_DN90170_c0_g1_i1:917-1915(-)